MASKRKVTTNPVEDSLSSLGRRVSDTLDADVLVYDGPIDAPCDYWLHDECRERKRRKNVLMMIHTHGGSADVAYAIARCLQRNYQRFIIYLNGCCKSAGTLIAIGANELVVPDAGELGPLDVQLAKPDELGEVSSGLTITNALTTLQPQAFALWEHFFLELKVRSNGQITTKSSSEIAAEIVGHLFAPIYAQIDPQRLGEIDRAVRISVEYGQRLDRNLKPDALARLVSDYPSHEFVIDREEAAELFQSVRQPTNDELLLAREVDRVIAPILRRGKYHLAFLDDILKALSTTEDKDESDGNAASRRSAKAKGSRGRAVDEANAAVRATRRNGRAAPKSRQPLLS